jgi:GNAT superfamily N-acetyltransferase
MNFNITTDKNQLKEIVALCIRNDFYKEDLWFITYKQLYPPMVKADKEKGVVIELKLMVSISLLLNPKFCYKYFVLTNDTNKVIGFIVITHRADIFNGSCFLEYLLIDEAYQGKGLSNKLFNEFFDWCKENNRTQIKIQFEPTDKLKYLYAKQGFKKVIIEEGDEIESKHENWYKFM